MYSSLWWWIVSVLVVLPHGNGLISQLDHKLEWNKLTIGAKLGMKATDVVLNLTLVSPQHERITATAMGALTASTCTAYISSTFHSRGKQDRRVKYGCYYSDEDFLDNGILERSLDVIVEVPDNATVSGNWTMIIDGKLVNSTAYTILCGTTERNRRT
jgi:hypothetical protein